MTARVWFDYRRCDRSGTSSPLAKIPIYCKIMLLLKNRQVDERCCSGARDGGAVIARSCGGTLNPSFPVGYRRYDEKLGRECSF